MHRTSATHLHLRATTAAAIGGITLCIALALSGCATAPRPVSTDSSTAVEPVPQSGASKPPVTTNATHPQHHAIDRSPAGLMPPSPVPVPTAPTDDELLAQSLAKLKQGNLVYNTPQKMKSSQTAHITARIGSDQVSVTDLQSSLPATAGTTTATVATPISTRMKMSLKSSDFEITPLSSEEQFVAGTTPTTWEWDVIPKHAGTLSLHLAATVELNNLSRDFAAIDRNITVQVDPVAATQQFVTKNLVWLLGGCGTALAALWGWWKKRKAKPAQP